jgi:hypothetical protein
MTAATSALVAVTLAIDVNDVVVSATGSAALTDVGVDGQTYQAFENCRSSRGGCVRPGSWRGMGTGDSGPMEGGVARDAETEA